MSVDVWNAAWGSFDFEHGVVSWLLLWARLAPLFVLVPWLALRAVPSLITLLASAVAACVFLPLALWGQAPSMLSGLSGLPLMAAGSVELLRGSVLSLGCVLPVWVFEASGSIADALRGAPALPREQALRVWYARAALVLALAASAQLGLVRWFVETLDAAPLGAGWSAASGLDRTLFALLELVLRAFEVGVTLSAPLLLGGWVIMLVVGLATRVAPSLVPASSVSVWPVLGVGLVLLSAAAVLEQVPAVVQQFGRETARVLSQLP